MKNNPQKIRHIAILMAMESEASSIISELSLEKVGALHPPLPMTLYTRESDLRISLITNGKDSRHDADYIGPVAAAVAAHALIAALKPDILISAGTCGSFSEVGSTIGSVYLSEKSFIFHDRRVPLPGMDVSSEGHYPSLDVSKMATDLRLKTGVVSTGSSLAKSESDVAFIKQHKASCKEMEAAAIAWVSSLYQQPFFAIKSVTNLLDEAKASESQFLENFDIAVTELRTAVSSVISYCHSKAIHELAIQPQS